MPDTAPDTINVDALFGKSKDYIKRAMRMKRLEDFDEYQLWASLALELLGKAALAHKHPSLVVDSKHNELSLFVAFGIDATTNVKTINAMTLFKRLGILHPDIHKDVQEFCQQLSERRNSELHSGEKPFKTMPLDNWESRYWHACYTILYHMESSLDEWLDAKGAAASLQLLAATNMAREEGVKFRIKIACEKFLEQKKPVRARLAAESGQLEPKRQTERFKGNYDNYWKATCPACKCFAIMAGNQFREIIGEERDDFGIGETVISEFKGEEFRCPTCELALMGNFEIGSAHLDDFYAEQHGREITQEREYGSD